MLARKHGTHWTQLYTTNPEIYGDPDRVVVGQLVRLGMIYRVKPPDTLMSIALKFGVSINQIFGWNSFSKLHDSAVETHIFISCTHCSLFSPNQECFLPSLARILHLISAELQRFHLIPVVF